MMEIISQLSLRIANGIALMILYAQHIVSLIAG